MPAEALDEASRRMESLAAALAHFCKGMKPLETGQCIRRRTAATDA